MTERNKRIKFKNCARLNTIFLVQTESSLKTKCLKYNEIEKNKINFQ